MRRASANEVAPTGKIMNSCIARLFPAWLPPFITLKAGTGITSSLVPDNSWICLYNGTPFAPAPALHTLRDTPSVALAPSFDLFGVPSNSSMMASTSAWFLKKNKEQKCQNLIINIQNNLFSSKNKIKQTKIECYRKFRMISTWRKIWLWQETITCPTRKST